MTEHPVTQIVKAGLDVAAVGVLAGYFLDHLPAISTGLTAMWYSLQIIDYFKKKK